MGEHLGQILTLGWVVRAALQANASGQRLAGPAAVLAALAGLGIGLGLGESLALALGQTVPVLAMATVAGHLGFSPWLLPTGVALIAHPFFPPRQPL